MATVKSSKQNKKIPAVKPHLNPVKNATKKAMAQYGTALRNLANR